MRLIRVFPKVYAGSVVLILSFSPVFGADYGAWPYRMKITFSGYDKAETLTNFPALVIFGTNLASFSYNQFASPSNGGDLRFVNSNETEELACEIEDWNTNANSYVWVREPALTGSNTHFWACWGNTNATTPPTCTTNGVTWSERYAAVWHLGQTNGMEDLHDSTVYRNNATVDNNTDNTPGFIGYGQYFDGGSDYISVPDSPSLSVTGSITVSAWVRPTSFAGSAYNIVAKDANNAYRFRIQSSGTQLWFLVNDGSYDFDSVNYPFATGLWHNVAATINLDAGEIRFYVNGQQVGAPQSTAKTRIQDSVGALLIGNYQAGHTTEDFIGDIDEVRITDGLRSSNWMWACWMTAASNSTFMSYVPILISNDGGASNVTAGSADLNGYLSHTDGVPTGVWVFYGQTDGGTNKDAWERTNCFGQVGAGTLTTNVAGLMPDRTYAYRFYASNSARQAWADSAASFLAGQADIQATDMTASEVNQDTGTILVYRPASATNAPLLVRYSIGGTASNGQDYDMLNGIVTIPAGQTSAVITVAPIEDAIADANDTVTLTLAGSSYLIGASSNATVTISDTTASLGSWRYMMKVAFPGYDRPETLSNFPALVILGTNIQGFSYDQFGDPAVGLASLRFADVSRSVMLNYEIETWSTDGNSYVWVQVPSLAPTNTRIWAYWRNTNAIYAPAYTTSGATWSNGYRAVWHMLQPNVPDSTANRHRGNAFNNVNCAGIISGAQQFDGNAGISIGYSDRLDLSAFTVSSWVQITNEPTDSGILGTRFGGDYTFDWKVSSADIHSDVGNGSGWIDTGVDIRSTDTGSNGQGGDLPVGVWSLISYVVDTGAGQFRLYRDGDLKRSIPFAGSPRLMQNGQTMNIGNSYATEYMRGLIDEARISSVPRSSDWIWACWMNQASNNVFNSYGIVQEQQQGSMLLIR